MWRKMNVTKRRSKGKWDEGHEREREWSKYQKITLKGERDSAYRPIDFYFKLYLASKQFVKNLVMAIWSTEKAHYKLQLHQKVEMRILIYINFQVSFRVMQT